LVPLCVRQPSTAQAIVLYGKYEIVVWWAAPVEIASALARLVRMKELDANEWTHAGRLATTLAETWLVVQPSDTLRARAALLVNQFELRAGDALQLAAGLEWCRNVPRGRVFVTFDEALHHAAVLTGFDSQLI